MSVTCPAIARTNSKSPCIAATIRGVTAALSDKSGLAPDQAVAAQQSAPPAKSQRKAKSDHLQLARSDSGARESNDRSMKFAASPSRERIHPREWAWGLDSRTQAI